MWDLHSTSPCAIGKAISLTTLPAAGWFATAPLLGGFGKAAQDGYVGPAALTAAKCCAVATPVSLVLRGLLKGYPPPTPFIAVSFVVTGTLLIGWRSALAAVTKPEVCTAQEKRHSSA